jgi:hypothetical protein
VLRCSLPGCCVQAARCDILSCSYCSADCCVCVCVYGHTITMKQSNCAGASQGQQLPKLSPCDVQALQKCLQENKGDRAKVRLS